MEAIQGGRNAFYSSSAAFPGPNKAPSVGAVPKASIAYFPEYGQGKQSNGPLETALMCT